MAEERVVEGLLGVSGELHSMDARRNAVELGRQAGAVSSAVATRRVSLEGGYATRRILSVLDAHLSREWFLETWADWTKQIASSRVALVGVGFEHPATTDWRAEMESRVLVAESEISRIQRSLAGEQ